MPTTCGRTRSTPAATASLTLYPRLTCISPRPYALRIMPTEGRDSAERQKYKFADYQQKGADYGVGNLDDHVDGRFAD